MPDEDVDELIDRMTAEVPNVFVRSGVFYGEKTSFSLTNRIRRASPNIRFENDNKLNIDSKYAEARMEDVRECSGGFLKQTCSEWGSQGSGRSGVEESLARQSVVARCSEHL
jgi:hypothetical protein